MKKFIYIGLVLLLVFVILSGVSQASKHPSDYHIGISYSQAIKSDKPMVALFYTDWCTYCQKFMPKFYTLSKLYGEKYNFVMINAEGSSSEIQLAKKYKITGLPTVYIIDSKHDNRVLIPNSAYSDLTSLREELDRYSRIRAKLDR